jgi:zinc and cadmium transporter
MDSVLLNTFVATFLVSLMGFSGLLTLSFRREWLPEILFIIISLSAGALFGDALIHLLPEAVEEAGGFTLTISLLVITGILTFFILEKFVLWHHHHTIETPEDHAEHRHHHPHSLGLMNIFGGALHDVIDGMAIAASFMISPVVGVSTTIAVILHEIPQEIGDFGVLIHSGYSVKKALFINFFSGLLGVLAGVLVIIIGAQSELLLPYLIPFTAGAFVYIAGSDLIPELKKETITSRSLLQLVALFGGILMMVGLTFLE